MSDMIKREDVLAIIDGRFSGMMIGDILKQDINALPEAEIRTAGRQCRIDRCELFNRLATITAEDANEMKAKIYAVIQEMPAIPERVIAEIKLDTEELMERIREEYELTDDIVRCKECKCFNHFEDKEHGEWNTCERHMIFMNPDDFCSYGEREGE